MGSDVDQKRSLRSASGGDDHRVGNRLKGQKNETDKRLKSGLYLSSFF